MEYLHILMAGITAIILFIFGLEGFSKEIERITGEQFRKVLSKATNIPIIGLLIGAIVTAVIQSSSATSVIAISLVNAGVLSFKNSVSIIFGSNIGTTITAQLVAFKLTSFAPFFIIAGFLLSSSRNRFSVFGKAVFYFGFVFFSLNLISTSLSPLQDNATLIGYLTAPQNPLYGILFGCLFTALIQSSSVTTGLAIIFTQQGLLGLENAVPLIMGANIGTTATAAIAMFGMDISAKKTAFSHFLFNVGGVVIFTPILLLFGDRLSAIEIEPAIALANIHLIFNIATSLLFIALIGPFTRAVDFLLGEGKMDFERLAMPVIQEEIDFKETKDTLKNDANQFLTFLQENYNLVTLSLETNFKGIYDTSEKRIEYISFLKKEYISYFSQLVPLVNEKVHSKELIRVVNYYDYLFQIHDSISDLFDTKKVIDSQYVELKSDVLLLIRDLAGKTLNVFDKIVSFEEGQTNKEIEKASKEMQSSLNKANRQLLSLLSDPARKDAGGLINFVTYSQRLKDKLINFHQISASITPKVAEAPATQ